jgi:hypothetical protein
MPNTHAKEHPSIATLIAGILGDLRALVRGEIALAVAELREEAYRARQAALLFATAAAALAGAGLLLLVAASLGVAALLGWPLWAGFVVVGFVLAVGGLLAAGAAQSQLAGVHAVPEQTVSTIKENSRWAAAHLSPARK